MYVLFDIGGTKTRIAVSDDLESFSDPVITETPQDYTEGIQLVKNTVAELCGDTPITAAVGGFAASFNREKTKTVAGGANVPDWVGRSIKHDLEEALNTTVHIENDTAMGGLAQIAYGPASGKEIVAYITVSTGVGGSRFVNGNIDVSAFGFEPEWQIVANPLVCTHTYGDGEWLSKNHCSNGYLVNYVGGTCTETHEGKKPYDITDADFWEWKAKMLAYGLHNIALLWSPDMIVVGGSMMNKVGIPLDHVKGYLAETLGNVTDTLPDIVPAQYGDEMGLYGAMEYCKNHGI